MDLRKRLEDEVDKARKRLENASIDTPEQVLKLWRNDYAELSFRLKSLCDEPLKDYAEQCRL